MVDRTARISAHIVNKIVGKVNQNEAGWSMQADFFADIPHGLCLGNQEAKTSERSENELEYFTLPYTQNNL
jgi:hypothetical protein